MNASKSKSINTVLSLFFNIVDYVFPFIENIKLMSTAHSFYSIDNLEIYCWDLL